MISSVMSLILATFVLLNSIQAYSQSITSEPKPGMLLQNITHGIITHKLHESRDFYAKHLDFEVVFENEWYIHMRARSESRFQVAFLKPDHHTQPAVFKSAFQGKGLFYTLEVPDVDALFRKISAAGIKIELPLTEEAWGERHFAIYDPNGVAINISQPLKTVEKEYQEGFKVQPQTETTKGGD